MSPRRAALCALLAALAVAAAAHAHEVRPAYLEITETAPGRYALLWRTPVLSGMRLPVALALPDGVRDVQEPIVQVLSDSLLERRTLDAGAQGLAGRRIAFLGLEHTITDVLVRVNLLDGTGSTLLVRPSQPWVQITGAMGAAAVAGTYLVHGVEHILQGFDHLLFVLALILIVRSARVLFWTLTEFTLAHSLTLALATLGWVRVPTPPIEAAIAASILLLASEVVQLQRGQSGLTARWPWVVAFAFGLLHGFGFATALLDVGLPRSDVPLALFAFNVGVELGQLAFVAGVVGAAALATRLTLGARAVRAATRAAPYAIGSLAAFWLFERIASF